MIGRYEDRKISKKNSLPSNPLTFLPSIKVAPIFLAPEHKHLISNYEDISIEKSVLGQLELAGCKVCEPDEADILLYVNNFEDHQGELVMNIDTKQYSGSWKEPEKPYMIADVRFANGADNAFVEKLFKTGLNENFLGYSAWNTSANTLGSLICGAIIKLKIRRYEDRKIGNYQKNNLPSNPPTLLSSNNNFKKLQVIRLLDDWAYQANVRQILRTQCPNSIKEAEEKIADLMKPFEKKVFKLFNVSYNINYKFPWNRLFEVEIELN